MIGSILSELGLRAIIEFIVYGTTYWIGYGTLSLVSVGRIDMAPFSTLGDENENKHIDWSIWLYRDGRRMLKMESVCGVGILVILSAALVAYLIIK